MKKLLLVACVVSFLACNKEEKKSCYTCTLNTKTDVKSASFDTILYSKVEIDTCNLTKDDVRAIEKLKTTDSTQYFNNGMDTVRYTESMTCAKSRVI